MEQAGFWTMSVTRAMTTSKRRTTQRRRTHSSGGKIGANIQDKFHRETNKSGFGGLTKTVPFIFCPILTAGKEKRTALKVTQPLLRPALPFLIFSGPLCLVEQLLHSSASYQPFTAKINILFNLTPKPDATVLHSRIGKQTYSPQLAVAPLVSFFFLFFQ